MNNYIKGGENMLILEIEAKEKRKVEHLEIFRVYLVPTGVKAKPKSWAVKKKATNIVPNNRDSNNGVVSNSPQ